MDTFGTDPDGAAVSSEVQSDLIEPFVNGVELTFREMLGAEAVLRTAYQARRSETLGDVWALIRLNGAAEGALVVNFPEQGAAALAARMLTGAVETIDANLIRDCVGEATNVIAGQGKTLLNGTRYEYTLSTPTVFSGAGQPIPLAENRDCFVLVFDSDLGAFALQLCLRNKGVLQNG